MISYQDSGVDKNEGYRAINLFKQKIQATHSEEVLNQIGGFAALYDISKYQNAVLVSSADGVGTKVKLAAQAGKYETIGIDCVAMCVNDILCHGAKPLFFLDYIATSKLKALVAAQIVSGMVSACLKAGCALIGGETAEMPGVYAAGDYDVAGFTVGIVARDKILSSKQIKAGDAIVGIASSGVHSNGFSLLRTAIKDFNQDFAGRPLIEELLKPTKIYVPLVLELLTHFSPTAAAHITGGGLLENLPRVIPSGLSAVVSKKAVPVLPIFEFIRSLGVDDDEMWGTFNMGVGFLLIVAKDQAPDLIALTQRLGEKAFVIGEIAAGSKKIILQ